MKLAIIEFTRSNPYGLVNFDKRRQLLYFSDTEERYIGLYDLK